MIVCIGENCGFFVYEKRRIYKYVEGELVVFAIVIVAIKRRNELLNLDSPDSKSCLLSLSCPVV